MTATAPTTPTMAPGTGRVRDLVRRRPLASFLLLAFGVGWPSLAAPAITGLPGEPFLALFLYGALLAPALIVVRWADGPGAVRRLLTRTVQWRFGLVRWVVALFGVPALTLAIGHGWLPRYSTSPTTTPDSSATSRRTAASSDSPGSTKPASVE